MSKAAKVVPMVDPIEEEQAALGELLARVKAQKGYKAAAIMTYTGELLAHDTVDVNIDLDKVGVVFNNIFRSAHDASSKIGLDACLESTIMTPEGAIIMHCSGIDAPIHFHIMVITSVDGNLPMVKMELNRITPLVLDHLVG